MPFALVSSQKRLNRGEKVGLGYKKLCQLNIGNPHVVGNTPISYYRQVLSLCVSPELMEKPNLYPKDVYDKARRYLDSKNMPVSSDGVAVLHMRLTRLV